MTWPDFCAVKVGTPAFRAARLMPEEYEIHRFHQWVLNRMEGGA